MTTQSSGQQPICITEGCGKERKWKGLCRSCYGQARHLIDSNEADGWDELERMGLVIEDDKPFKAAFKKKKRELTKQENKGEDQLPSEPESSLPFPSVGLAAEPITEDLKK